MLTSDFDGINYENVLNRRVKPAFFSPPEMSELQKERFLVTGAGGSIGSRIVKLLSTIPKVDFLATDRDETALHSLSLSLTSSALFNSERIELLDIRDQEGVKECFSRYRPTTVIHAAALKHLSALQKQPREAILTNVFGTANLLEAAHDFETKSFVNVSTDKAASPSSVLGITKHLAELYTYFFKINGSPGFTNCRFGNVFNSRGSVIETFSQQMQTGAPITLTDASVERYFMHVDEAAFLTVKSLVLNSGDVHIFEMGEPILMIEIVRRMQSILHSSSQVLITGLREGEKMNELLVEPNVRLSRTEHPDIQTIQFAPSNLKDIESVVEGIKFRDYEKIFAFIDSGFTRQSE